jgi:nucleotide-binding universal stress UspA family protein
MYSRILIPLDGSKLAERVLPHAIEFARVFDACLVLLRVLDPSSLGESQHTLEPFAWQIRKAEADVYLKTTAARLRQQENLTIETVLLEGKTAENIIDYTQNQEIDLLAISTHGASGLSRWSSSSVFQKVIAKVYQHILIVRAYQGVEPEEPALGQELKAEEGEFAQAALAGSSAAAQEASSPMNTGASGAGNSLAALTSAGIIPNTALGEDLQDAAGMAQAPTGLYQRILLPIDTSRRAECALPAASTLAERSGAALILAAVIRRPEVAYPVERTDEVNELTNRLLQVSRESTEAYLGEIQGRLHAKTETRIVENDSVPYAIHDLADQENASLVVFCAHGYTGRMTWPYGSVVQNYIDHGTRPVLVVQDMPRSQVRPTAAERAAEKYGRR